MQKMTRVEFYGGGSALSDGGSLISCRPDGTITTVPLGAPGPHEQCAVNGNIVTYAPSDGNIYNFPFVKTLPNYPGWSGMYLVAL